MNIVVILTFSVLLPKLITKKIEVFFQLGYSGLYPVWKTSQINVVGPNAYSQPCQTSSMEPLKRFENGYLISQKIPS